MQQRGVDISKVEQSFVEMAYSNMRQQAERDVRGAMLLDRVAEMEKVDVTDDEVNEELTKMSQYYGAPIEEIRESLEKQGGGIENSQHSETRKSGSSYRQAKVTDGDLID